MKTIYTITVPDSASASTGTEGSSVFQGWQAEPGALQFEAEPQAPPRI